MNPEKPNKQTKQEGQQERLEHRVLEKLKGVDNDLQDLRSLVYELHKNNPSPRRERMLANVGKAIAILRETEFDSQRESHIAQMIENDEQEERDFDKYHVDPPKS